jgi:ribosomal protein L11 methyltransferase
MDFIEVRLFNNVEYNDVIIAWLGENEYDMFEEREDGVNAYIAANLFNEENLKNAINLIPDASKNIRYFTSLIKDQNWNKKWESNFEPVFIEQRVYIRAPFHEPSGKFEHEIVIEPKMSFGTGHHATTTLMMQLMLQSNFKNKSVLDMGCGTGVLAILSKKLGANKITAIDIDEWAFTNSLENCAVNDASEIIVKQGNASLIENKKFEIILANINRNILLEDLPKYVKSLNSMGEVFLSGILIEDFEIIFKRCLELKLELIKKLSQNNWLALHLIMK